MFDLKMFLNQTDVCNHYFQAFLNGGAKFEDIISNSETIACADEICSSTDHGSLEMIALVYKLISLLFKNSFSEILSLTFNFKLHSDSSNNALDNLL